MLGLLFAGHTAKNWHVLALLNLNGLCDVSVIIIMPFKKSFIEVELIYNVVPVSGVQHVYIYIHKFFFRFFSLIGYYNILNRVPCAIE